VQSLVYAHALTTSGQNLNRAGHRVAVAEKAGLATQRRHPGSRLPPAAIAHGGRNEWGRRHQDWPSSAALCGPSSQRLAEGL